MTDDWDAEAGLDAARARIAELEETLLVTQADLLATRDALQVTRTRAATAVNAVAKGLYEAHDAAQQRMQEALEREKIVTRAAVGILQDLDAQRDRVRAVLEAHAHMAQAGEEECGAVAYPGTVNPRCIARKGHAQGHVFR